MSYCRNCGGRLEQDMDFCPFCGTALAAPRCLRCGRTLDVHEKICPLCNTPRGKLAPKRRLSESLTPPATMRHGIPSPVNIPKSSRGKR